MITVQDVLRQVLPPETVVVAGRDHLGREVTWASRLRAGAADLGHLGGGDLVLMAAGVLELIDERLTLESAVRQLARRDIAAIAFLGVAPADAIAAADEAGLPLLILPERTELGPLERDSARWITDRRRAIQRRGQEVGSRLIELAIAGEDLDTTIRSLAEQAGRSVALEGVDGRLFAFHAPEASSPTAVRPPTLGEIEAGLTASRPTVAAWLRTTATSSPADPPSTSCGLDERWSRIVAPVIGRDGLLGSLSLLAPRGAETLEDGLLAARGAAACAIVLARDQAALSVRREVELNVLDEVLDGALRSETTLLQQARRLKHNLELPHFALVARADVANNGPAMVRPRENRWQFLADVLVRAGAGRDNPALWRVRHNVAEIVWPAPATAETGRVAQVIHEELAAHVHHGGSASPEVVSLGFGRPRGGIAGIRHSHHEARQALALGRRLKGIGHVTGFDELGVYRLIFAAESLPELRSLHDEALDALIAYDQHHGADLVSTLESFFKANCGPKEAAKLLGVHRNTVLYRLDRITEITGQDLDDAAVRLRLQLALHIHMALFASGD